MVWCPHCAKNSETHRDYTTGSVCCVDCGKVVSQDIYSEDATFVKDAAGGAHLAGNLVRMESACAEAHRRTLEKGNVIIYELIDKYGISNVSHATKYYQIAVERGFTRGRRTAQVAAACLYVASREKEKPFLLIEFSNIQVKEKRKRALEAKNAKPAQTAAEAAGQLFTKKKLSSKINYDMLNTLFDDEPSPKKNHVDDGDAKGKELGKEQNETDDVGAVGEEEEDMEYNDADTGHEWDYDNEQAMNGYGYGYDDGAYDEEY